MLFFKYDEDKYYEFHLMKNINTFRYIGHNSMNIWYIRYIFFCPYIICYIASDKWILFSKIGVVAVILGVIISFIISMPFTYIDNKFIKKINISR